MNVLYKLWPRNRVYGVPMFLAIESSKYNANSLWFGGAYMVVKMILI